MSKADLRSRSGLIHHLQGSVGNWAVQRLLANSPGRRLPRKPLAVQRDVFDWVEEQANDITEWAGDKVGTATEWAENQVDTATEWVEDKASGVADWAGETVGEATEWVEDKTGAVADWAEETAGEAADWVEDKAGGAVDSLSAISAVLQSIAAADPESIASSPTAASQWLGSMLGMLESAVGEASSAGTTDGTTGVVQRKPVDHLGGLEGLARPSRVQSEVGIVVQRQGDPDAPFPPVHSPGCCDKEYAEQISKWTDVQKGEIDVTAAVAKARDQAKIAAGICVGGLTLPGPGTLACVAAAGLAVSFLRDAQKENDKWGITIAVYSKAREAHLDCWAKSPSKVCPLP
ncbi:MAG TPA: hypothetical protein VK548_24640 [Candidatus Acidoferrum sp.]|nr:hypothetical protein [Candidatus Acidoferrum sp.]